MSKSLLEYIKSSLASAQKYNSSQTIAPQAILWPDPGRQWLAVIDTLRAHIDAFLTYGEYQPEHKQGPAIWIKCMVNRSLPEASWAEEVIPVIYLPGISKEDFRNIEEAPSALQPLMEYQFTGNIWTQENGREWTVLAFLQNKEQGMGLDVSRDEATREALAKALPRIFEDGETLYRKKIDADFLNELMFPQIIPTLLDWIERGGKALELFPPDQQAAFRDVIKSQYGVKLDYSTVLDIVRKLGSRQPPWRQVWQYFANAPHKYPQFVKHLRDAKPDDLGEGMFALPRSSWPQINEKEEKSLINALKKLRNTKPANMESALKKLEEKHKERLSWIWAELGQSPMASALPHLVEIAGLASKAYPCSSISELVGYYTEEGYQVDTALRAIYTLSLKDEERGAIETVVGLTYRPWLEKITAKFQELLQSDHKTIYPSLEQGKQSDFILFVDAFRYDLAREFCEKYKEQFQMELGHSWAAVPSVTPTSKPSVSPITDSINPQSEWNNFSAQLRSGKPLNQHHFKSELSNQDYQFITHPSEIEDPKAKYWMEIGDIDKKGHQEQVDMLQRIPELMEGLKQKIEAIMAKGVKTIQVVTDHGWLLLPGNLPKESLHRDLAETRWGRCTLLKEGVKVDYQHLPWAWNPEIFIAFAPGISFFRKNEAYAHGGLSLHECLTPVIKITAQETPATSAFIEEFTWKGVRLDITTQGADDQFRFDVRTRWDDPESSVMLNCRMKEKDTWTLLADGDHEGEAAALLLFNPKGIIVDKKLLQIGG